MAVPSPEAIVPNSYYYSLCYHYFCYVYCCFCDFYHSLQLIFLDLVVVVLILGQEVGCPGSLSKVFFFFHYLTFLFTLLLAAQL